MAPKAQKEPSWIGLGDKGPWDQQLCLFIVHLRPAQASKELKYWLSRPQGFTVFTPSVKQPLS